MSLGYVDFSNAPDPENARTEAAPEDEDSKLKTKVQTTCDNFPAKLHYMLEEIERDGLSHIASWQSHGRCFAVHRNKDFEDLLLPFWFRQTKFASFQRQLNIYGFRRITSGPDKNGYYHELFLRGKRFLCKQIRREKIKGTGPRKPGSPETEPNFHVMTVLPKENNIACCSLELPQVTHVQSIVFNDPINQSEDAMHTSRPSFASSIQDTQLKINHQFEPYQINKDNKSSANEMELWLPDDARSLTIDLTCMQQNRLSDTLDRALAMERSDTSLLIAPNAPSIYLTNPILRNGSLLTASHGTSNVISKDVFDCMHHFQNYYLANTK